MVPALPRLTGDPGTHGAGDSVGGTPLHRPARSRSDPHQVPTMGTASGCGTTVWWYRPGIQVAPSLRLTGERTACPVLETGSPSTPMRDRHPWSLPSLVLPVKKRHPAPRCGAGTHGAGDSVGGTPLHRPARSRSDPHQVPTMGTASGCGTTTTSLVLPPYIRHSAPSPGTHTTTVFPDLDRGPRGAGPRGRRADTRRTEPNLKTRPRRDLSVYRCEQPVLRPRSPPLTGSRRRAGRCVASSG